MDGWSISFYSKRTQELWNDEKQSSCCCGVVDVVVVDQSYHYKIRTVIVYTSILYFTFLHYSHNIILLRFRPIDICKRPHTFLHYYY
jgi:hypothetical protein